VDFGTHAKIFTWLTKMLYLKVSLKIILKNKKGEILLLTLPDTSTMAGFYDLPGGRIKMSELTAPFKDGIDREMREEVGDGVRYKLIETPIAIGRHRKPSGEYIMWIFFEAQYKGGRVEISSEHKGFKWVKITKKNLSKYFVRGALEGMSNYVNKKF